jgi:hypothetical protein
MRRPAAGRNQHSSVPMKALTIWQPWASLIMAGCKPYEFRRWAAPQRLVGQRLVTGQMRHVNGGEVAGPARVPARSIHAWPRFPAESGSHSEASQVLDAVAGHRKGRQQGR